MSKNSHYEFTTRWEIPAPVEKVWELLMVPERWPQWWRGVKDVRLLQPAIDASGVGAIRDYTWRSRLPYDLTFTMETTCVDPFSRIEGIARGELSGFGCWQFKFESGVTHVRYDWTVEANKWWMIWLAPIARPVFEWNHDAVMDWRRQGLLAELGIHTAVSNHSE